MSSFDTTFIPASCAPGSSERRNIDQFYQAYEEKVYRRVDRLFFVLMAVQWLVGILFAVVVSPHTWRGASHSVHPHIFAALFLGGLFCWFPMFLIWRRPGHALTRHVVAVGQVCFSGLLIHLSGGRIESHFHVFGSLAFLACYRDWKILLSATVVVAVDHLSRGFWFPQSVYGVALSTPWRSLEHAGWVIFEDIVLIWSCFVSRREMRSICEQQYLNQELLADLENRVRERTCDLENEITERQRAESGLRLSEERFRTMVENAPVGIYRTTVDGTIEMGNPTLIAMLHARSFEEMAHDYKSRASAENPNRKEYFERANRDGEVKGFESIWRRIDGSEIHVRENAKVTRDANGQVLHYEGTVEDVTDRKRAEQELKELNAQLVNASRQAGMAEVATGVLHNVGNVLNSVNVSTTLIREKLQQSRLPLLSKAMALLREHPADLATFLTTDPKGRQWPAFVTQLTEHLTAANQVLIAETDSLDHNVQHIRQIVSTQQSFARVYGVTETLPLESLLEEAIQFNSSSFTRHAIRLVRQYAPVPPVTVDRHKVLQILINLLRNAKQALRNMDNVEPCITLSILTGSEGRVRLAVSDTGVGIAKENLPKIFQHGFTTKENGHGFGLHAAALAAQEMKGTLTVQSGGPRTGATFTLELPTAPAQLAA